MMTKNFVTWNEFDLSSIDRAKKRKLYLENNGYILIDERPGCLTYIKYAGDGYKRNIWDRL